VPARTHAPPPPPSPLPLLGAQPDLGLVVRGHGPHRAECAPLHARPQRGAHEEVRRVPRGVCVPGLPDRWVLGGAGCVWGRFGVGLPIMAVRLLLLVLVRVEPGSQATRRSALNTAAPWPRRSCWPPGSAAPPPSPAHHPPAGCRQHRHVVVDALQPRRARVLRQQLPGRHAQEPAAGLQRDHAYHQGGGPRRAHHPGRHCGAGACVLACLLAGRLAGCG
jgi:hypothetical protein